MYFLHIFVIIIYIIIYYKITKNWSKKCIELKKY